MDAHKTTFPDNNFDKVYSFYTLCVVRNPLKVLEEVKRVCKDNGRMVMFEHIRSEIREVTVLQFLFWSIGRVMGHVWIENFPPYRIPYNSFLDLFSILEDVGLKIEKMKVFDPPYNIVHLVQCINKK